MLAQLDLKSIEKTGLGTNLPAKPAEIIDKVLPYVFGAAGIALLIYLIMGGLQLMLSKGDPKAVQGAQAKITNALIGFVVVITSFVLVRLLGQLLGIGAFRPIFGY